MDASLKQTAVEILEKYGYRVTYTPYHSEEDIKRFSSKEKNIDTDEYFTVFNEGGYVVCRLSTIKEPTKFSKKDIEKLCEIFEMFEITNREAILEQLKTL